MGPPVSAWTSVVTTSQPNILLSSQRMLLSSITFLHRNFCPICPHTSDASLQCTKEGRQEAKACSGLSALREGGKYLCCYSSLILTERNTQEKHIPKGLTSEPLPRQPVTLDAAAMVQNVSTWTPSCGRGGVKEGRTQAARRVAQQCSPSKETWKALIIETLTRRDSCACCGPPGAVYVSEDPCQCLETPKAHIHS